MNGAKFPVAGGAFDVPLTLAEGPQAIEVQAFAADGRATEKQMVHVVIDRTAPVVPGSVSEER